MPSEVWGYRVGDHVEIRLVGRWVPGKVTSFDVNRNLWVRIGRRVTPVKVASPTVIRRLKPPAGNPDQVDKWLED